MVIKYTGKKNTNLFTLHRAYQQYKLLKTYSTIQSQTHKPQKIKFKY